VPKPIDINEILQSNPGSKLENIRVKDVITVAPSTKRVEVEAFFRRHRFRAIPVVGDSREIVGVVREKDAFSRGDEVRTTR
jgi:Mg/Co/Ni transporter MgtE